jgi:hypothetical protein
MEKKPKFPLVSKGYDPMELSDFGVIVACKE